MTGHDQSMHCPLFSRPSQMWRMQCAAECDQSTARAVCSCGLPEVFTSIAIDRARRSSPVVRSCQRSIASVSTASKRRHLLEVLPWLNFTPDTQQVPAKRFSFILAGGHVRASAGALAVHTALIPCVCLCVRYQTPFSSRHESGPSLFLSTGKHLVGGQLPRVFFSALPGQSSDRPNLPPHQKTFDFQFPFASIRRAPSEACSGRGKRRIDRSTSKRSSKKLQRATITAFFLDRSLVVVHCDRS